MSPEQVKRLKMPWLVIAGSIPLSPVLLFLILYMGIDKGQQLGQPPPSGSSTLSVFGAIGLACLIASIFVASSLTPKTVLGSRPILLPPAMFQQRSLVAFVLAEVPAI